MIQCPGCGAGMRFDPVSQMVKCDFCETKIEPETATPREMIGEQVVFDSSMYTCPSCGAEIMSDADTVATFCSFCGASVMLAKQDVKMLAPSYVLPFKVAKETVSDKYKKMIKSALYAPSDMKQDAQLEKMRGIYIPYWNYDFEKQGEMTYKGSRTTRRGDYIITDHYALHATVDAAYDGIAFDASSSFADELSEAIAPFNVRDNKPFSASYLAGFYADTADVQAEVYAAEARDIVQADIGETVRKHPNFRMFTMDMQSPLAGSGVDMKKQEVSYFPVWFLARRHKDKVSYAVINGQTGKVAADIPIDYKKYLIGSVIMALPIILLLNLIPGFGLTPQIVMIAAIIFAIISYSTANSQLNMVYTRRWYLNDKGLQSVRGGVPAGAGNNASQPIIRKTTQAPKEANGAGGAVGFFFGSIFVAFYFGAEFESMEIAMAIIMIGFAVMIFRLIFSGVNSKKSSAPVTKRTVFKANMKDKMGTLWKPLVSIILGVLVLLANPVQDVVFYGAALVVLVLVLISLFDVVRLHNELTMRLPRQFAKRGGDETDGI